MFRLIGTTEYRSLLIDGEPYKKTNTTIAIEFCYEIHTFVHIKDIPITIRILTTYDLFHPFT